MKSKRAREAATSAEEEKPVNGVTEEPPSKKRKADGEVKPAKKAKKDKKESRKERKDKKKDLLDLPAEEDEPMDGVEATPATQTNGDDDKKKAKKSKKNDTNVEGTQSSTAEEVKESKTKKEKKDKTKGAEVNGDSKQPEAETTEPKSKDKKDGKKKSKADKKAKSGEAATATNGEGTNGQDAAPATTTPAAKAEAVAEAAAAERGARHIVFVGNLPYTATTASVSAHFSALRPVSVRCLTKREDPAACRGIAFVEFASAATQRTCLDRFHHSLFEDGVSAARKVNVELTAGGGGKTKHRQDKIMAKNKKLDENRAKRIEREKAAKEAGGNQAEGKDQQSISDSIHPSRLARNPLLGH